MKLFSLTNGRGEPAGVYPTLASGYATVGTARISWVRISGYTPGPSEETPDHHGQVVKTGPSEANVRRFRAAPIQFGAPLWTYGQTGTAPIPTPFARNSARAVRARIAPLLRALHAAVNAGNWHAALALAFALPDICAGIEVLPSAPPTQTRKLSRRAKKQHRAVRGLPSGTPINGATGETVQESTPTETEGTAGRYRRWLTRFFPMPVLESLKPGGLPAPWLDDEDLYLLRCAYLHSGHEVIDPARARRTLARVRFTWGSTGGFEAHRNFILSEGILQLDVAKFCEELSGAVNTWLREEIDVRPSGPWNTDGMLAVVSMEEALSSPSPPLWNIRLVPLRPSSRRKTRSIS